MTVDPNDEISYQVGAEIYGAGFEDVFNVSNFCSKAKEVLKAKPSALHEWRSDGNYNDLSSCTPCTEKTKENRHGGNEPTRWRS
jgi:hypothetical protein